MLSWITANLATILISFLLIVVVGIIIVKMVKDKKQGKSSCGCDCGSCGACCGKGTKARQHANR